MGLQTEVTEILEAWQEQGEACILPFSFKPLTCEIMAKVGEVVEGVENPYTDDVHLAAGVYDGLKRKAVEEFRQAILKAIKND